VAQQVNVRFVDDIDGSEASETVYFGLDGRQYVIDLSEQHTQQLRDTLATFVAVARRGTGRRSSVPRTPRPAADREQTARIREWAQASGQAIAARGGIPKSVMEAYANRDCVPPPVEAVASKKSSRKRSEKAAD
jgi:Lsr2